MNRTPILSEESEATHGQRRVWAAQMSSRRQNSEIIPLAYIIEGPLDVARLESCLAALVEAHEALRTNLVMDDVKLLRKASDARFKLQYSDKRVAPKTKGKEALLDEAVLHDEARVCFSEPFAIAHDLMLRARLICIGEDRHMLLMAIHHSAGDGWSFRMLQRQLCGLYAGGNPAEVLRDVEPHGKYVRWVRERESTGYYSRALAKILHRLGNVEESPSMRGDYRRWEKPSTPRFFRFQIPPAVAEQVGQLAQRQFPMGSSCVYQAAFQLCIVARNGRAKTAIGCPVANRSGPAHQGIFGFLVNIVVAVQEIDWSRDVASYLNAARRSCYEAMRDFDVPYGLVLRELLADPFRFDVVPFEALFTYQPLSSDPLSLDGCRVTQIEPALWAVPFEFMLDIEEREAGHWGLLRWDGGLFRDSTIQAFVSSYLLILKLLYSDPGLSLSHLKMLVPQEWAPDGEVPASSAAEHRRTLLEALKRRQASGRNT